MILLINAGALAERLIALQGDRSTLARLEGQCAARAALFTPAAERYALLGLLDHLVRSSSV